MFRVALSLALLPLLVYGAPSKSKLPACDDNYRPCKCPSGTTFKNLTSFGIIGAPAKDVRDVMANFFDLDWQQGLKPSSTSGKPAVPGARRNFNFTGPSGGAYQITEVLTQYSSSPDGSFVQGYEQAEKPAVVKVPGGGEYHGEWALVVAQQSMIANETVVAYKNWRCEVGETFGKLLRHPNAWKWQANMRADAASSHERGIANVSSILHNSGKDSGVDISPFTIFYEVRND
ncbi:MAG: hypothetical protein MMC23_002063 [Stictis urceolatum]|nr:hypothetical protein [Stictis urceolata]